MRKLTFMLLILLAAIGCSKKEEDTPKPDPVVLPKYMEYTGVIEADQSVVVLKFDGYFKMQITLLIMTHLSMCQRIKSILS